MDNKNDALCFTENQKELAALLNGDEWKIKVHMKQYDELFERDCPFPIKKYKIKIIASVIISIFTLLMVISFLFKEWVGIALCVMLIAISLMLFSFVRNIKYPNEQFSIYLLMGLSAFACVLFGYVCFNSDTFFSNIYYLSYMANNNKISLELYEGAASIIKTFSIISGVISIGIMLFGIIFGNLRLSSLLTPLICIGGMLVFAIISNSAFNLDFIIKNENKMWLICIILIGACIALALFDIFFIYITKKCGGAKSKHRK